MTRKARQVEKPKEVMPRLYPANKPTSIGKFGSAKTLIVNEPPKGQGARTTGVIGESFDKVAEGETARLENPKNVSVDLSGMLRKNDPLERRVGIPTRQAIKALEEKRQVEKVLERAKNPNINLLDEAKIIAKEKESEMIEESLARQRKAEYGVHSGGARIAVRDTCPEFEAIKKETAWLMQKEGYSREEVMEILSQTLPQETVIKVMEGI